MTPTILNVVPAPHDPRDYKYLCGTAGLPSSADLRPYLLGIENQEHTNSCTANAGTSAAETFLARGGKATQLSRLFLYFHTRSLGDLLNNGDAGAYMVDICRALTQYGVCTEDTWPFVTSNVNQQPPIPTYAEAAAYKADRYERIEVRDYKAIKSAVARGYPVLIGMHLYAPFGEITGPLSTHRDFFKRATQQYLGGHAMAVVGYDDAAQYWIVANSWGTSWGDNGFVAIPYHDLERWGFDFWVVTKFAGIDLPDLWTPTPSPVNPFVPTPVEPTPNPKPVVYDSERAEAIRAYLIPKLKGIYKEAEAVQVYAALIDDSMGWTRGTWDSVFGGNLPYVGYEAVPRQVIRDYLGKFLDEVKSAQEQYLCPNAEVDAAMGWPAGRWGMVSP